MGGGGWWGATKWRVTAELCIFQGEMAHKEAPLHSNCHKTKLNQWSTSSTSRTVISSRVVACTSQPVASKGHPSTHGRLTGLRNKLQQKQTCQHSAVVYWQLVSLLMVLSIDGENFSLTWCA